MTMTSRSLTFITTILIFSFAVEGLIRRYREVASSFPSDFNETFINSFNLSDVMFRFACAQQCNRYPCCRVACKTGPMCELFGSKVGDQYAGTNTTSGVTFDTCITNWIYNPSSLSPVSTNASSSADGSDSGKAVDRYLGRKLENCFTSRPQWRPWWMADLGSVKNVTQVRILTRQDGLASNFLYVVVRLGNSASAFPNMSCPINFAEETTTTESPTTEMESTTTEPINTTESLNATQPANTTVAINTTGLGTTTEAITTTGLETTTEVVTTTEPITTTEAVTTTEPATTTYVVTTTAPATTTEAITTTQPARTTQLPTTEPSNMTAKPLLRDTEIHVLEDISGEGDFDPTSENLRRKREILPTEDIEEALNGTDPCNESSASHVDAFAANPVFGFNPDQPLNTAEVVFTLPQPMSGRYLSIQSLDPDTSNRLTICNVEILEQKREPMLRNCVDVRNKVSRESGLYTIYPRKCCPVEVYCDMDTDGGGWTVFQRRHDVGVMEDFYRTWAEYMIGFGEKACGEFWLGLEYIHALTHQVGNELRIVLEDYSGNIRYANYATFYVGGKETFYTLTVSNYTGTAGDSLTYHNGQKFSAKGRDLDSLPATNCAALLEGGWWYNSCHYSNLNGRRLAATHAYPPYGIEWYHMKGRAGSLRATTMMTRPAA